MAGIEIACPGCGKSLKIPDPSLLGKKVKCSQCAMKFVLELPPPPSVEEVAFELATPPGEQTLVGIAPRFVTDERDAFTPPPPTRQTVAVPASTAPVETPAPGGFGAGFPTDPMFGDMGESASPSPVLKKRRKKRGNGGLVGVMVVLIALGGGAAWYFLGEGESPKKSAKGKAKKSTLTAKATTSDDEEPVADGAKYRPSEKAKPIELRMIPGGAYGLVHLRPAELWKNGGLSEEVRACLGPLGKWAEEQVTTRCLFPPAEIDEALFCLVPALKGEPPGVVVVVRTRNEMKRSSLQDKFNGEQMDEGGKSYFKGKDFAYLIQDSRTFAICPADLATDMVAAADEASSFDPGIDEMLAQTDRSRPLTVVFNPARVRDDSPFIAPVAGVFLSSFLDWFGDEVEGVIWSASFGDKFDSRLLLRNSPVAGVAKLSEEVREKVARTPHDILEVVQKTHPRQAGRRKVVGRFPAMTQVFAKSSKISTGPRLIAIETSLPDRAAPNLALGALLAWDLTIQPDYGSDRQPAAPTSTGDGLPATVAERLKKKITVDFRNELFDAALGFVCEEVGITFKMSGNDLKAAGVTQNERVEFKMDDQPATAVLFKMLRDRKTKLCITVDEGAKQITVTTDTAAEEKKLTTFPLEPGG
jgi:hypothetical protein